MAEIRISVSVNGGAETYIVDRGAASGSVNLAIAYPNSYLVRLWEWGSDRELSRVTIVGTAPTVATPTPTVTGTITASPNPVPAGQTTTTITWSVSGG